MRVLVLLFFALVITGCSKTASGSGGNAAGAAAVVTSAGGGVSGGNACDRHLISETDVQPLLGGPITSVKPLAGDPRSCVFATAGFSSVTVTFSPDEGKAILESWRKGPVTALPGVGDDAVWEPDLKEVVAARGDSLCTVTAMGPEVTAATAQSEGALCNKIFAGL
jgi:hypothetical protein